MAAFQEILDVLPARYRTLDVSNVQELRLRAGQSPAVVENGAERRLAGLVRQEELSEILQRATQQSAYACTQSLRQGFVTLPGGHRIGVCGSAVVKNGELAGYQELSSLCIRFARELRLRPLYRELLTLGMFRRMFVLLPDRQFRCVEVKNE